MAQPQHGGARAPDRKPRPPAGPGKLANRQDLSKVTPSGAPGQGAYVPSGLPYGDATKLMQAQQAVPAAGAAPPPAPARPAGAAAPTSGALPMPPLAELLGRPTDRPTEPVTAGLPMGTSPASIPKALAFKVDVLSYMQTLPFAGPEITTMLRQAQQELVQAQLSSLPPAPPVQVAPLTEPAPPPVAIPPTPEAPAATEEPPPPVEAPPAEQPPAEPPAPAPGAAV